MRRPLLVASLALQFLLELAALAALGYWGSTSGDGTFAHVALAIAAPLLAAVVWGCRIPKTSFSERCAAPAARGRVLRLCTGGPEPAARQPVLGAVFVVTAVVDGALLAGARLGRDRAGLEDPAEHRDAVQEEPELRRDVRRGEEQRDGAHDQPGTVACQARPHPLRPSAASSPGCQRDGEHDPDDGEGVRPLRIEVALGLDAGVGDRRAEGERDERDEVGATILEPIGDDRQHRDRREGGRKADEDECATGSADEARVRDLPQVLRRDAPVGLENRDGSQSEQEPDHPELRSGPRW